LFLPFPGWTLPGVVGAGGIQALVKQGLVVGGKRIVVAGSGPLLLAVADLLRGSGAEVPVIIEQAPAGRINAFGFSLLKTPGKLLAGIGLRARLLGTRYATGCYPTAVTQQDDRLRVEYKDGRQVQTVDCDFLACGFGLIPNNEIARLIGCDVTKEGFVAVDSSLRTSVKDVYAIGELTGIGGVDKAILEGQMAGLAIAGDTPAGARLAGQHAAAIDFTHRLAAAFALRDEVRKLARRDTLVCRCEDVPLWAVAESTSARDAKLQTRCGMGPCQGRICGPIMERVLSAEPPGVRPPVLACEVGSLCGRSSERV
jgi:NADPH-dependent 2,4-dienoyl-CoA reductase/sulfur reductase-like enzyme